MSRLLLAAGLVLVVLGGCGGPVAPELRAGDCWGLGSGECEDLLKGRLPALGLTESFGGYVARTGRCGATIECPPPGEAVVASNPGTEPRTPPPVRDDPTPAVGDPDATRAPTPTPRDEPERVVVVDEPGTPGASGEAACADIAVLSLESKTSLTPAETLCLQATAEGRRNAPDAEIQVAAVTLFNNRAAGWPAAVEAALKRPALKNAPSLSRAGIKPAYDRGRYSTVLVRARNVWSNLDKGYQLSAKDKTFVTEFACRSAGQLALSGDPPDDGLTWCERWFDRAERAGADTGPIQDLIDQLE